MSEWLICAIAAVFVLQLLTLCLLQSWVYDLRDRIWKLSHPEKPKPLATWIGVPKEDR